MKIADADHDLAVHGHGLLTYDHYRTHCAGAERTANRSWNQRCTPAAAPRADYEHRGADGSSRQRQGRRTGPQHGLDR